MLPSVSTALRTRLLTTPDLWPILAENRKTFEDGTTPEAGCDHIEEMAVGGGASDAELGALPLRRRTYREAWQLLLKTSKGTGTHHIKTMFAAIHARMIDVNPPMTIGDDLDVIRVQEVVLQGKLESADDPWVSYPLVVFYEVTTTLSS